MSLQSRPLNRTGFTESEFSDCRLCGLLAIVRRFELGGRHVPLHRARGSFKSKGQEQGAGIFDAMVHHRGHWGVNSRGRGGGL